MNRELYRFLSFSSKEQSKQIYCPFCGEKTFKKDSNTNLCTCSSCDIKLHSDVVLEELNFQSKEEENLDFLFDSFKYVILSTGHYNIEDASVFTEDIKVNKSGIVHIEKYIRLAKGQRIHLQIEDGYLKNIIPLKKWIKLVLELISNSITDEIQPCDAGGTIKTLKFNNLTINNLSMWTGTEEDIMFFHSHDFLKNNYVMESSFNGDPKTYEKK